MCGLADQITDAIRTVAGAKCALHEPVFEGKELEYVEDCVKSGWVSSVGSYVDQFEEHLAAYTGAKYAVATVNGTAALHVALILAGVSQSDEVICPSLTFIATANAITYCGAKPFFVDVEEKTLGMDAAQLDTIFSRDFEFTRGVWRNRSTGNRVAAILPMHTFGHPCDIHSICEFADRKNVPVVEDAAESLGSLYRNQHTGTFGSLGVFSFNGNKIITAGGGGAIVTNDANLARHAKHLTTTAKLPHAWCYNHDQIGYNYRMPNLNAALACAQLEQLEEFVSRKRATASRYEDAFKGIPDVTFVGEPDDCRSNYWLNTIKLSKSAWKSLDDVLTMTNQQGLMTRPCWTPLNRLPMYSGCPKSDLSATEDLCNRLVNVPSGAGIQTLKS